MLALTEYIVADLGMSAAQKALLLGAFFPVFTPVRAALQGRLSALSVSHSKPVLYSAFVWARRALNIQKRRFLTRAVNAVNATPCSRPGGWAYPGTMVVGDGAMTLHENQVHFG